MSKKNINVDIETKYKDRGVKRLKRALNEINSSLRATNSQSKQYYQTVSTFQKKNLEQVNSINANVSGLGGMAKSFSQLTTACKAFMALAVVQKFKQLTNACLNAASDMEELENITKQVFGRMALDVKIWAREVSSAMGRSVYQMQKSASDIGNILRGYGNFFDDSQIKNMSEQLAILATDMGSFLNISDERASQAIIAGLTGEAESLKRLGFNIQDTTIKEYALAQGITKNFEAMSQAEKAQLRYQKLLEITKHLQGDAVRTIDSYANQVKLMGANFSNLAVAIGEKLKPAAKDSIGVINALVGGLNRLLTHKTDVEFIADAVTQQADVLRLVKSYETLDKELKTLKEGTSEYKIKADELKTVQSKLIELSPKFADAFNNPKDKIQALKDAVDDTTASIYKMITAQMKQQAIEEVQAREGTILKRHQQSYNKFEKQLTTSLSKNGINANEIADVISILTENDYKKAMTIIEAHHKNAYNVIQKEAEAFSGSLENSNDNFTSNFATHSAALVSYFANAVQKSVKDMVDATEKAYARIGIAEKGISKRLGLKYNDPRLTKNETTTNEESKPGSTITEVGITGGSSKAAATKVKDKWESLRDSLKDLEKNIDDIKLDKVFNEIKDLNTAVLKKQLGKLEQLAGVLSPTEILSERVRIYEQSINTLKELAQGTKDKDKLKVVLDKYKEVNSLLEQAKEQLDEENKLESIQNEIKVLIKGTSEAVKGKLTEKANIQNDIELAEISKLETRGLITKLEATRRRLTSLDTQIKILEENGAYDELYNQKLQAQSLKIQETLLALDKTMQTEELSTAFRTQLEKLSRFAAESLDVESAKKAYKDYFDTLVKSIQSLPKELKDKFKNLKDLKQIDKDIKEMLNDSNISNEVKNILNALQKLLGETASQLEKSKKKSSKDEIDKAFENLTEIAGNLGLNEMEKGLDELKGMFDEANNLLISLSEGEYLSAAFSALKIVSKLFANIGGDDGSEKVRKEVEKEKEKFNEEIIAVNNSLRDSVDKLDRDMKAFNKTLIKGIAANTSNANIFKNQKIADEMSELYLNAFDAKVKTTIARKKYVDNPALAFWMPNDHWEYDGTETKEESLRNILGIASITSTDQLRELYYKHKQRGYSGSFEDRPHEGNFFTTEVHHYKDLIGSNFDEALEMMLVFADNADRMKKYSKNTARYGILESFEGLEVTSAGQLKEQALEQMKRLVEASGQDYSLVASKLEAKLNEIIKEDEVIVSAFDDVRNSIHQGLSAGNEMLDTLSNGLQGYFNKIRNNLAKIKYDMEFRDFESGFNKKFQELSEHLVKIRLDNKKSLKDLDPKYLNFSTLFKQLKDMEKVSNDIRDVVANLREQAAAQGISQDIIDKMLPLDKITDKASQISEMLKNAMSLALDMSSFDQFTMSLGDSIYKHVKEAMLQAFVESAKFKELYQDYINTEEYRQAVEQAESIREVYDVMSSKLQQFENKLKAEGLAFRETNASNGEYLGGFVNGADTSPTYGSLSGGSGYNITINTTIDNKGYIAVEELTEDITNKVRYNMEQALKREVS